MSTSKSLTMCVFIDAFGWEILKRHPFLDGRLQTKAPLETVFGYSSTCDPTILTGALPQRHGHFSFFYYAPGSSPFRPLWLLSLSPRRIVDRGRVRRLLSRVIKRLYGYTGYFQLYGVPFQLLRYFDYSEKKDIYAPGGINAGLPTIFDRLRRAGWCRRARRGLIGDGRRWGCQTAFHQLDDPRKPLASLRMHLVSFDRVEAVESKSRAIRRYVLSVGFSRAKSPTVVPPQDRSVSR